VTDPGPSDRVSGERPLRGSGRPEAPASSYGTGPVPPGAYVPRREDVAEDLRPPAEYWRRAVAAIIDFVIVGIAAALVLAVALLPLNLDSTGGTVGAIVVALLAVLAIAIGSFLYAPLVMARTGGLTFGKMATGCRVVRADGRPIDFLWAVVREVVVKSILVGIASAATGGLAWLANYLWPLFDKKKRALHDLVVDSRVVRN
jgi:uncharacterized RDD family membrane protein YckC